MALATKYTPDRCERIFRALALGATYRLAAAHGGITDDTFTLWRKRHREFDEGVRAAEAEAALGWLRKIEDAAEESWQAAAWKLERRYPNDYGRRVHEVQGAGGGPVRVVLEWPEDDSEGEG